MLVTALANSRARGSSRVVRRWARTHALIGWLLGGMVWAFVSGAQAQTSSDRALAEALFQEGRTLMLAGNPARACAKFEESQRLELALGTLLNLAACYEAVGKTASAWAEYARALALAERVGDRARSGFAEQQQARLAAVLARLTLHTEQPRDGLRMAIDGKEVRGAAWGTPLPLDPGVHHVRVWAPGRVSWEQRVVVNPGPSAQVLHVPTLEPLAGSSDHGAADVAASQANPLDARATTAAPPAAPKPGSAASNSAGRAAPSNGVSEAPSKTASSARPVWMWSTLGLSAAALATGTVATLRFRDHRAIIREHCRGQYCDSAGLEADKRARSSALVADISFGVGALALLVSGYLWYTTPAESGEPSVAVRPAITADGVWLSASGHY